MMFCKDFKEVGIREIAGTQYMVYWAAIYADTTPNSLPLDGTGVDGLPKTIADTSIRFAPSSTLFCANSGEIYVMSDANEWKLQ